VEKNSSFGFLALAYVSAKKPKESPKGASPLCAGVVP